MELLWFCGVGMRAPSTSTTTGLPLATKVWERRWAENGLYSIMGEHSQGCRGRGVVLGIEIVKDGGKAWRRGAEMLTKVK